MSLRDFLFKYSSFAKREHEAERLSNKPIVLLLVEAKAKAESLSTVSQPKALSMTPVLSATRKIKISRRPGEECSPSVPVLFHMPRQQVKEC